MSKRHFLLIILAVAAYFYLQPIDLPTPKSEPPAIGASLRAIYAIGDCHGDLKNTINILQAQRIINEDSSWIANDSILIQTGDIVDRGPDTILLYKLFQQLKEESRVFNGAVISLLGNHEVMNMMNDMRFVHKGDTISFGGVYKRKMEWSKTGSLGRYLRSLDVTTIIDDSIFVHGGISFEFSSIGIDKINQISKNILNLDDIPNHQFLVHPECPLWYRGYANDPESIICPLLSKALTNLKAKRMVIGHTPQLNGKVLARCNMSLPEDPTFQPRVYVVDVGISQAYGGVGKGVLEILLDRSSGIVESVRGKYFGVDEDLFYKK